MRKIWLKPERTGDKTENFVPLWRRIAPFSINLFPAIPDTTITKKCRPLKEWTDRVRAFVTYKKNRARMIFLCFVSEAYKKNHVHILVSSCTYRKLYMSISLCCTKQKDVTELWKKSQNNRQNHVQSAENTSKIKLKRCIIPFAFGVLSLLANTFQEIFLSKINIKRLLKKETYFWRKT